ncbi:hypothetical protein V6R21_24875 [Limibacter armeniacum]|uniref:hypothetical protein n=1 Tax=Limibacter armeniacum TaxID=466084 RepID=UPI002FE62C9B
MSSLINLTPQGIAANAAKDVLLDKRVLLGAGALVVLGIAWYWSSRANTDAKINEVSKQVGSGTREGMAVELAMRMYAAISGWGTDEEALYEAAKQMRLYQIPFSEVASYYNKLYQEHLISDLQGDLSASQMVKFNQILNQRTTL